MTGKQTAVRVCLLVFVALALAIQGGSLFLAACSKKPPSEEELFLAGQEAQRNGAFQKAIESYQELLARYPESQHNYKAQFMIGYIYSEELKDYDKARVAFQAVIDNYPANEMVESARWMLENMGKDLDEIEVVKRLR